MDDDEEGFVRRARGQPPGAAAAKRRRALLAAAAKALPAPARAPSTKDAARTPRVSHLVMALGDAFEKSGFAEDLCDALADVKAPILSKLGTYIPPPRALDCA